MIETWGNDGPGESPDGQLIGPPTQHVGRLNGLTVDASGDLWDLGAEEPKPPFSAIPRMFEFAQQTGGLLQDWTSNSSGFFGEPIGIAVDGAQHLYTPGTFEVVKFNSNGEGNSSGGEGPAPIPHPPKRHRTPRPPFTGFAVDPASEELYLDEAGANIAAVSPSAKSSPSYPPAPPPRSSAPATSAPPAPWP